MSENWDWEVAAPRAVERLWRFVDARAVGTAFAFPTDHAASGAARLDAVLDHLGGLGLVYRHDLPLASQPPPDAWGQRSGYVQRIRHPFDTFATDEVTCLDVALLAAGACIAAGLRCWIMIGSRPQIPESDEAHAWLVVDPDDQLVLEQRGDASPTFEAWETAVLAGLDDDRPIEGYGRRLCEAVLDPASGARAVDVTALCHHWGGVGSMPVTGAEAADLGTKLVDGTYADYRTCDVGWWWDESRTHPNPNGRATIGTAERLVDLVPLRETRDENQPSVPSLARLLRADRRLVGFVPTDFYTMLVQDATRWLDAVRTPPSSGRRDRAPVASVIAVGLGGAGKTRTAIELLVELSQRPGMGRPALMGHLARAASAADIETILGLAGTICLVLDYGEAYPVETIELLRTRLGARPAELGPVLIVATGREDGEWIDDLSEFAPPCARGHAGAVPTATRSHLATSAVRQLARRLAPGLDDAAHLALADTLLASLPRDASALDVVLGAGLAVAGDQRSRWSRSELLDAALVHEAKYWRNAWDAGDRSTWSRAIRRTITAALTWASVARPTVAQLTAFVEQLPDSGARAAEIADVIEVLYGDPSTGSAFSNTSRRVRGLEPDPLADHLIREAFADDLAPVFLQNIGALEGEGARAALAVLNRALGEGAPNYRIIGLIVELLGRTPMWDAARQVATAGPGPVRSACIEYVRTSAPREVWEHLAFDRAGGAAGMSAAAAGRWVAVARQILDHGERDIESVLQLERALGSHASRLADVGDPNAALESAREALTLARELAARGPGFEPTVARALFRAGVAYSRVGDHVGGLEATQEAVDLFRELSRSDDDQLSNLAAALDNLGLHQRGVGELTMALATTQEAYELHRQLAGDDDLPPDAAAPFSTTLVNLGLHQAAIGDHTAALATTQRAVALLRGLADDSPTYRPLLGTAMLNLGWFHAELGNLAEARTQTCSSIELLRELAQDSRAFDTNLSIALTNLGQILFRLGDLPDALGATTEAVDFGELLGEDNPAARPQLALALLNLGQIQSASGDPSAALATTQRAATMFETLAGANPAHRPHEAMSVLNLGQLQAANGDLVEALATTRRAVSLLAVLSADNPVHRANHASALVNLGGFLAQLGEFDSAVVAASDAIDLFRRLVDESPVHRPGLAMALMNHGYASWRIGDIPTAITSTFESVDIYRAESYEHPVHRANLAQALNNLSAVLTGVDDAGALRANQEAVDLLADLADENSVHRVIYAMALMNLAACLSEEDDTSRALAAARQAADLYDQLAAENPAHERDRALAITNLGRVLANADDRNDDAVAVARRAVVLHRALADEHPTHLGNYADALASLAERLDESGEHSEARNTAELAISTLRDAAGDDPAMVRLLADALSTRAGWDAIDDDDRERILAASHEATSLYRDLVETSDAHSEMFAWSLRNLSIELHNAGDDAGAREAATECVELYRRLALDDHHVHLVGLERTLDMLGRRMCDDTDEQAIAGETLRRWDATVDMFPPGPPRIWLHARRAERAVNAGNLQRARSDLDVVASADFESAAEREVLGDARRFAIELVDRLGLDAVAAAYRPVPSDALDSVLNWSEDRDDGEVVTAIRASIGEHGLDALSQVAARLVFAYPDRPDAARFQAILRCCADDGVDATLSALEDEVATGRVVATALRAAAHRPVDTDALRAVFADERLVGHEDEFWAFGAPAADLCAVLARLRGEGVATVQHAIDLLDLPVAEVRHRTVMDLDRRRVRQVEVTLWLRPDAWSDVELKVVEWVIGILDGEGDARTPPPTDGVGPALLRSVVELAGQVPALEPLLTTPPLVPEP